MVINVPNGSNAQIPVWYGGTYSLTGNTSIRIGQNAGFNNQKDNSIAICTNTGRHENGIESIAIGLNSGRTHQSQNAISIGSQSGSSTQGESAISICTNLVQFNQKDWGIAIGYSAGNSGQLNNSISIGGGCGYENQGTNSVALGIYAGFSGQGENCVAIGNQAGLTSQPNDSIVINAGNLSLSGITQSSCYIQPIRNVITGGFTSNIVCYDNVNKKLIHADNIRFANPVSSPSGTVSDCGSAFQNDSNTGFYSTALDTLEIATGGSQRMSINNSRMFVNIQIQGTTGSAAAPSFSFGGNGSTGIYSGGSGSNIIKFATNGIERLSVDTTSFIF